MLRWMSVVVVLSVAIGCSVGSTKSESPPPTEPASGVPSPDAFAGVWRSVTPSLEFVRLSVYSTSSQMGVLAARLTYSGVAWEGSGRIEGDSLVTSMATIGSAVPHGVMVAHRTDARTLRVRMRATGSVTELTFVREN